MLSLEAATNNKIVSIYGQFDPRIPKGSYLEGAKNIQLDTYGHFRTINDPEVHQTIIEGLNRLDPRPTE